MASAAAVGAISRPGREDLQEVLLAAMTSSKDEMTKRLAKDRKQLEGKIQGVADALETRLARESNALGCIPDF
jgi:hypothetical protein